MSLIRRTVLLLAVLLVLVPVGILAEDAPDLWDVFYFLNFVLFGLLPQVVMVVAVVVGVLYFFRYFHPRI